MKDMGEEPNLEKGTYCHYKGGLYDIIGVACHTETLEWHVIYQSHERNNLNLPSVWVRPYKMFIESVVVSGKQVPRFEKVRD